MVTREENERLAVLETKVASIEADVAEIKGDVKMLVATVADMRSEARQDETRRAAVDKARASTGVWVRSFLPWVVAVAALLLALVNTLARIFDGAV